SIGKMHECKTARVISWIDDPIDMIPVRTRCRNDDRGRLRRTRLKRKERSDRTRYCSGRERLLGCWRAESGTSFPAVVAERKSGRLAISAARSGAARFLSDFATVSGSSRWFEGHAYPFTPPSLCNRSGGRSRGRTGSRGRIAPSPGRGQEARTQG